MLRVGILGKTDSARRKEEIVASSDVALLVESAGDPRRVIEASELIVLADSDAISRAEIATLALRRGRHVFSDWPLTADADALRTLWQTAEESGVEFATNRPDRLHPWVLDVRERGPMLTDVVLSAGLHYRFENLLTDALDLCLFMNGGSAIHRYEAEALRDDTGSLSAVSFALRFHSGSLAVGHIRKADAEPVRTVFVGGSGWNERQDLLSASIAQEGRPYDPSTDERSFVSCVERLAAGKPVETALHDLEETVRAVDNIMSRTRGQ